MKEGRAPNIDMARAKYIDMCKLAKVKPEISTSSTNKELFAKGEKFWNALPVKAQRAYLEDRNLIPRANPLAFKWFVRDRVRFFQATGWRWLVVMIMSPFRYPGFLLRSRKVA